MGGNCGNGNVGIGGNAICGNVICGNGNCFANCAAIGRTINNDATVDNIAIPAVSMAVTIT